MVKSVEKTPLIERSESRVRWEDGERFCARRVAERRGWRAGSPVLQSFARRCCRASLVGEVAKERHNSEENEEWREFEMKMNLKFEMNKKEGETGEFASVFHVGSHVISEVGSWDGARLTVMFLNFATPVCLLLLLPLAASEDLGFTFNGFRSSNLTLDGVAEFTPNGLLALTNGTKQQKGHAFFPNPITFKTSPNSPSLSFSTTFVFSIIPQYPNLSGHGIVFIVSPTRALPEALPSQYLGLFNETNNDNHFVAVELDTIYNSEFNDINDNHVGIDINSLVSKIPEPAGYYDDQNGQFHNLTLISGKEMQVWVDYDGVKKQMNVTMAPINTAKPRKPLCSMFYDLSSIVN
ncbi:unnamed protein product [Camellia sinensis]